MYEYIAKNVRCKRQFFFKKMKVPNSNKTLFLYRSYPNMPTIIQFNKVVT